MIPTYEAMKSFTIKDLKKLCKELGAKNYSKLSRDDLISTIEKQIIINLNMERTRRFVNEENLRSHRRYDNYEPAKKYLLKINELGLITYDSQDSEAPYTDILDFQSKTYSFRAYVFGFIHESRIDSIRKCFDSDNGFKFIIARPESQRETIPLAIEEINFEPLINPFSDGSMETNIIKFPVLTSLVGSVPKYKNESQISEELYINIINDLIYILEEKVESEEYRYLYDIPEYQFLESLMYPEYRLVIFYDEKWGRVAYTKDGLYPFIIKSLSQK